MKSYLKCALILFMMSFAFMTTVNSINESEAAIPGRAYMSYKTGYNAYAKSWVLAEDYNMLNCVALGNSYASRVFSPWSTSGGQIRRFYAEYAYGIYYMGR